MGENTKISWAHHTHNIVWGCQKVSPACDHCYAEVFANRTGHTGLWGPGSTRRTLGALYWHEPFRWDRAAAAAGERRRVFVGSMCDWAENHSVTNTERAKLWMLIRACPNLDWMLLTKRADRIAVCLPPDWGEGYPNVRLGVTAEDRAHAKERIPRLLAVPLAQRAIEQGEPMAAWTLLVAAIGER